MWGLLVIATALIVVHECGHMVAARRLGGAVQGAVFRGLAVGVRLVLPPGHRPLALTSLAGPAMEGALAFILTLAMAVGLLPHGWIPWTLGMVGLDWIVNLVPVGATDGARIWRAWQAARGRYAAA
jgi:membrane-associated protease RseP (regulator of RpoE activity)